MASVLVRTNTSVKECMAVIGEGRIRMAVVVDESNALLGVVTDGDIRRGLLEGLSLDEDVSKVMNAKPVTIQGDESKAAITKIFKTKKILALPVVSQEGVVKKIITLEDILGEAERDNPVFILAGGSGKRLKPLTDDCPKPMLKVGPKPILENIIESFAEEGFHNFYISLCYKPELITKYFGDGSKWGVNIAYIYEDEPLGTAGSLSLLPDIHPNPVIVVNGDILTKLNVSHLLDFHHQHGSMITSCVRDYTVQIPYGMVNVEQDIISSIEEKPQYNFFVNAGIYVIEKQVIKSIPKDTRIDMPDIIEQYIDKKEVAAFPVYEYWTDIGQIHDLEKARLVYEAAS